MNNKYKELLRLNFEDLIWVIFIILAILDIVADDYLKKYIINDDKDNQRIADKIYLIIIIITLILYLYFFFRNYRQYKENNKSEVYFIKLFSSCFFIAAGICLLYFQLNNSNFIGGVAL